MQSDLPSDARWVGSRRLMSYRRRIRLSFATIQYPGDGTPGQSASHTEENLIMVWPSDIADPPALLLLHIPGGVGPLVPHCSSCLPPPPASWL
jgi:hypothetical protein